MESLLSSSLAIHGCCSMFWSSGRPKFLNGGSRSRRRGLEKESLLLSSRRLRCDMRVYSGGDDSHPVLLKQPGATERMAWLGKVFSKSETTEDQEKAEESARKLFEDIRAAEIKRTTEEENLQRRGMLQAERDFMQITMWNKFVLQLQGKLKGTPWDPEPSHPIDFSEFWKLVESQQVHFIEYAEFGKDVAVVLPYYKENEALIIQHDRNGLQPPNDDNERELIYKRHQVSKMPADAWGDLWPKLHQQLHHLEVKQPNSVPALLYPTLETTVVWGMRLALAIFLYQWIDRKLYPIYKLPNPQDRPVIRRPKLSTSASMDLGSLGQSRARFISAEESTGVTFNDFAGQEYVKRELEEVVRILKESKEFEELGIYCPKGVMLYGPPGTGKTLLAKAIAGEAGVPFFSASGSEFVEMFVGVAAARVRDLFARARQFAPSIIFIDEIDAIGAKRGGPDIGGGGVEREQGLIQILTELDGFQSNYAQSLKHVEVWSLTGVPFMVMVVGATNRLDMLDPALLRKGRFDKTISIGLPSEEGRLAILRVHARNKGFRSEKEKEELLKEVAAEAHDFSGAELQNVLNEAAILAARKDKDIIESSELAEAMKRVASGLAYTRNKKVNQYESAHARTGPMEVLQMLARDLKVYHPAVKHELQQEGTFSTGEEDIVDSTGEARLRVAYREAAIALLECYFPNPSHPFTKVLDKMGMTNIREIDTYPNMEYTESRSRVFSRKPDMIKDIVRACAPRIVEELVFGRDHLSWISGSALAEAGVLGDYLILRTGMTALGKVYYRTQQDLMVHLGPKVVALREEYMRYAVEKCSSILKEYRSALETLAELLLEREVVEANEIWDIFNKAPRFFQPEVKAVDEYGALIYVGRWGIHGVSLPGRVTFRPGNVGYATFGAPRPLQLQVIKSDTWNLIEEIKERNLQNLAKKYEEDEEVGTVISLSKQFL